MARRGKKTAKRGRPEHVPTKKSKKQVEILARIGTPHEVIAKVIGISADTLKKYYEETLENTRILANATMGDRLYRKGMSGNVAAMIFWMKTRAGWRETGEGSEDRSPRKLPGIFTRGPDRLSKTGGEDASG